MLFLDPLAEFVTSRFPSEKNSIFYNIIKKKIYIYIYIYIYVWNILPVYMQ